MTRGMVRGALSLELLAFLVDEVKTRDDIRRRFGWSKQLRYALYGATDRGEIRNLNAEKRCAPGQYVLTDKGRAILRREGRPAEPQALQWHAGLQLQAVWAPARA